MLSWILNGGIGLIVAPPNEDHRIGNAPDKGESEDECVDSVAKQVKQLKIKATSPPAPPTPPAPPQTPFQSPLLSPQIFSPNSKANLTSPSNLTSPLAVSVLSACTDTALSLSSPNAIWEKRKAIFNLCASQHALTEKKIATLTKKITKDPSLLNIRSCNMAPLVPDGYTPLHAAAGCGNVEAVKVLLSIPTIDVEKRDMTGRTALHIAAAVGSVEVIRVLKEFMGEGNVVGEGAPVDLGGRTPLGLVETSHNKKTQANRKDIEEMLYSPGDKSICPITPLAGRYHESNNLSFGYGDLPGWRVDMEDDIAAHYPMRMEGLFGGDDFGVFGVFDGHGGELVSKFVAENINSELLKELSKAKVGKIDDENQVVVQCLTLACEAVDKMIQEQGTKLPGGSTGVIALVSSQKIFIANVGDSRAVIVNCDGDGSVIGQALSTDHNASIASERARVEASGSEVIEIKIEGEPTMYKIKKKGGQGHDMISVSRAFGDFDYKGNEELSLRDQALIPTPEITVRNREGNDVMLLLACDGIWDVVSNDEAAKIVHRVATEGKLKESGSGEKKSKALAIACDMLLLECLKRDSRDNMTAMIVQWDKTVEGKKLGF